CGIARYEPVFFRHHQPLRSEPAVHRIWQRYPVRGESGTHVVQRLADEFQSALQPWSGVECELRPLAADRAVGLDESISADPAAQPVRVRSLARLQAFRSI